MRVKMAGETAAVRAVAMSAKTERKACKPGDNVGTGLAVDDDSSLSLSLSLSASLSLDDDSSRGGGGGGSKTILRTKGM